jgi:alditol oxidase
LRNWAGNYAYAADTVHRPATLEQLQEVVAAAPQVRVLGSRHSFTGIGDSHELVSLERLPADVAVEGGTVSVGGGVTYGALAAALEPEGLALHNLASLPHISIAGAIATATHGSGDGNGNLATAVAGLELVTSDGELVRIARGDPDFEGAVVGLGALGALTRVTLDVEPAFEVRQWVYEGLAWDALLAHFDAIMASAYSVSVFTTWEQDAGRLWVKSRGAEPRERFGAVPAAREQHPVPGLDPVNCTAQHGVPGPWWDRLPHFRMGFTPSNGEEIQSEYLLPREHAAAAIEALRGRAPAIRPLLQVCELRTIAADRLWMSPQYERDCLGVHFTWRRDQSGVERALVEVEAALAPFDARPHWGKLFLAPPCYERAADFARLAARFDPRGAFRNPWFERLVGGRERSPDGP